MADRDDPEVIELWDEFHRIVNMSSRELRDWLLTAAADPDFEFPDEGDIGLDEIEDGLGEAVLDILGKRKVDLTDEDLDTMGRVVTRAERLLSDPPPRGAADDRWRHRLMSLGHDPLQGSTTGPADPF
jgi:Protein of unknown function (DUF3140)